MKIKKIYENSGELNRANQFAKLLSEKFFDELDEFYKIIVEEDEPDEVVLRHHSVFIFTICFNEIFKETIEQIEKFQKFMGYTGWALSVDIFDDRFDPKIYEEFHLEPKSIEEFLEKLEMEKSAKKYNL